MNADVEEVVADAAFVRGRKQGKKEMLEWLEKWCNEHSCKEGYGMMPFVHSQHLLLSAKKESERK